VTVFGGEGLPEGAVEDELLAGNDAEPHATSTSEHNRTSGPAHLTRGGAPNRLAFA
jgi:hypothetical protein